MEQQNKMSLDATSGEYTSGQVVPILIRRYHYNRRSIIRIVEDHFINTIAILLETFIFIQDCMLRFNSTTSNSVYDIKNYDVICFSSFFPVMMAFPA